MNRNAVYNRDFVCTMVIDKPYNKKISDVTYNTMEGFKYVIVVKSIEKMLCDVNNSYPTKINKDKNKNVLSGIARITNFRQVGKVYAAKPPKQK